MFRQTQWDKDGYALRDPDSTTYVGAIETAEEFGQRLYVEAWKRGWSRAQKKVLIGDGAEWIWNLAQQHFPGAIQIVDLFHARQHLWDLARKLHPNQAAKQQQWMQLHQQLLDRGKLKKLTVALRSLHPDNPELAAKLRIEADYFQRNALRMRYPKFRRQHLFVGSGVIEAGCKTKARDAPMTEKEYHRWRAKYRTFLWGPQGQPHHVGAKGSTPRQTVQGTEPIGSVGGIR